MMNVQDVKEVQSGSGFAGGVVVRREANVRGVVGKLGRGES
jgi:hypothetical protein